MLDSRLRKLKIRDAEYVEDESGATVLHVRDPHALSQAAGYLKHVHGSESRQHIYFRGQTELFGSLAPSLFRGSKRTSTHSKRIGELKARIRSVADSHQIFRKFSETFYEPLLQHYGFQTTWVDLVDNIWIALWFAGNSAVSSGANAEYLHFEQRKPDAWKDCVYIILVGADLAADLRCEPGFVRGAATELVDLRVGAPSIFLRPHSQHGLLFRVRGDHVSRPSDYSSQIRGIIRAELRDALEWIGRGALLNVYSLFPPPSYDRGYGLLLDSNLGHQGHVGGITHIGA